MIFAAIMSFIIYGVNSDNLQQAQAHAARADNIILVPEIFIPHFTDPRPYQIWRGSRFSAKSWTKALQMLYKADTQPYFRGVFARNTQKAARDSQFQLFIDLIKRYRHSLGERFYIEKGPMKIIHKENGHYIQGGSFENPDALLSVPEITDFWAEEPISRGGSISRSAFEDIAGTLRNSVGIVPQFHFTFNPIGKMNFVYEDFYNEDTRVYTPADFNDVIANYDSNPFCPPDRIDFLNKMKERNPRRYLVDGLGQWGEPINDAPYLSNYDDHIHYSEDNHFQYGQYDTWVSFDFNHTPCTASVYQIIPKSGVYGIRSYKQNGGTRKLCQLMKQDAQLMGVNRLLWNVTGDSNGKNYTATGGDVTDYEIIQEEFGLGNSQIIGVHSRNKSLVYSRRLNDEFLYHVPFALDASMVDLRRDLMIAREDDHGNLYKNRKDGYGMDFLDHHRYFVHAICPGGLDDVLWLANSLK